MHRYMGQVIDSLNDSIVHHISAMVLFNSKGIQVKYVSWTESELRILYIYSL